MATDEQSNDIKGGCPWLGLSGSDWLAKILENPGIADECRWTMTKGEACFAGMMKSRFGLKELARALLLEDDQFGNKCPRHEGDDQDWIDRCPWMKLSGHEWARLLAEHPRFAEKNLHVDQMNANDWRFLMERQPGFAETPEAKRALADEERRKREEREAREAREAKWKAAEEARKRPPRLLVLRWDPATAPFRTPSGLVEWNFRNDNPFPRNIWAVPGLFEATRPRDIVFVCRMGTGSDGIVAAGIPRFHPVDGCNDPKGPDDLGVANFQMLFSNDPDRTGRLQSDAFAAAVPDVDWRSGPAIRILDEGQASAFLECFRNEISTFEEGRFPAFDGDAKSGCWYAERGVCFSVWLALKLRRDEFLRSVAEDLGVETVSFETIELERDEEDCDEYYDGDNDADPDEEAPFDPMRFVLRAKPPAGGEDVLLTIDDDPAEPRAGLWLDDRCLLQPNYHWHAVLAQARTILNT